MSERIVRDCRSSACLGLVLALIAVIITGCGQHIDKIGDINDNPSKYVGQSVVLAGHVSDTFGLPLGISDIALYKLEDDSGLIWVVTHDGAPDKGTEVGVNGVVKSEASMLPSAVSSLMGPGSRICYRRNAASNENAVDNRMLTRSAIKIGLACTAMASLTGCGNYETQLHTGYTYVPMVSAHVVSSNAQVGESANDPISGQPDPLMSQQDHLATQRDPLLTNGADPMTGASNDGSNGPPHDSYGRYWINGNVSSGSIDIAVNGTTVGTYSSHVDLEVSQWCHKGENIVTFTHHPVDGSNSICGAHLSVYDGLRTSSPLVFTYDTSLAAAEGTSTASPSNQLGVDDNGGIQKPTIPVPGSPELANPADTKPIDGLTDERDFDDNQASSGKPSDSQ